MVASDASSRTARSIPMAAVGRKNCRMDRPAVILSASVAPTTSTPMRNRTLSRCQRFGRNRHSQASNMPTSRTASMNQPTRTVGWFPPTPRPRASIFSISEAVSRVPLRTMTSRWAILTMIGATAASARSRSWDVSSSLNDEFGTTRSWTSSAASIRCAASSPPAMSPVNRFLVAATSVSLSSVRRTESRTRAASVRTASQPSPSSPASVVAEASVSDGMTVLSRAARSSAVMSVA